MEQFFVRTASKRLAQVDARGPQLIDKGPIAPHFGCGQGVGQTIVGDVPIDEQVEGYDELGKEFGPFTLRADGCGPRRLDQPHRYIEWRALPWDYVPGRVPHGHNSEMP